MTRRPSTLFDRAVDRTLPRIYALADFLARPVMAFIVVAALAVGAALFMTGGVTT